MKQKNLIRIWLSQGCYKQGKAIELLQEYGHDHSIYNMGDIGGAHVMTHGMFFEFCPNGQFMIIQAIWYDVPTSNNPVEEPLLFDMIAWHPNQPNKWFYLRGETGLILGEKSLFEAQIFGAPLYVYETPLEWLQANMEGIVLLDFHSLHCLIGIEQVVFTNPSFGQKIKKQLTAFIYRGFPNFGVDTNQQKG